jgi:hypothetical protein
MKRITFLMMTALLLLFACKDNNGVETITMEVAFSASPNTTLPPVQCLPTNVATQYLPGGGWITGTATGVGTVNKDASPYIITGCIFGPNAGQLTETLSGRITGEKSDYFYYTGTVIVTFATGTLTGEILVDGGTGKYKNAKGIVTITGTVDFVTGAVSWTGKGNVTMNKN